MSNDFLNSSPSRNLIDPLIYHNTPSNEDSKKKPPHPASNKNIAVTTGWTPLISKTFFNEQLLSYSNTPNKLDIDYQNFSLTPFYNNHLSNITPLQERTLHLQDFFIDSPENGPIKDLQTITPSKFNIATPLKKPLLIDRKPSQKRSIGLVDTPPRLLSKATKSVQDQINTEDKKPVSNATATSQPKTPSKLSDITNRLTNSKEKKELSAHFETPPKQQIAVSSPSTEIMSSAVKDSPKTDVDDAYETDEEDGDIVQNNPNSPTPKMKAEPVMGVFSERKKPIQAPPTFSTMGSQDQSSNNDKKKLGNKRTQGRTKFQIVFTDVHTLMNSKTKKKPEAPKFKSKEKSSKTSSSQAQQDQPLSAHEFLMSSQMKPLSNSFSEHNISTASSKEVSLISHNNSHLNTTDHSSFDLGGLSSTPNSKFILDKVFDKQSPHQFNNYFQQYGNMPPPSKHQHPHIQQQQPQQPLTQQQQQHQQLQQQQQQYAMMMSTPQHQNVMNYVSNLYQNDNSPTGNDLNQVSNISYNMQSPQNFSVVNMNGQSVMMPMIATYNQDEDSNLRQ